MPAFLGEGWSPSFFPSYRAVRKLMTREELVHELFNSLTPLGGTSNGLDTVLLSIKIEKGNINKMFSFWLSR